MAVAKQKKKSSPNWFKKNMLPLILSGVLFIFSLVTYQVILADKYFPLTFVGDTNISFLTEGQAIKKVENNFQKRASRKLTFSSVQGSFEIDISTSSAALDYSTLASNFSDSHTGNFRDRLSQQLQKLVFFSRISPKIYFSLDKQLIIIASAIDESPKNAELIFDETPDPESSDSARIQIKEGKNGIALDKKALEEQIKSYLLTGKSKSQLPLKTTEPPITTNHVIRAKQALESVIKEPIKLTFEGKTWELEAKQLLTLLDLTKGETLLLDKNQTDIYIKSIAQEIDQQVQEGLFEFNPNTKRVTAFKPSQEGRKLNLDQAYQLLTEALTANSPKTITLPVEVVKPKIATSDINSLGIKELLGRGVSNFAGSIENRIYNVGLTAAKINGVLIAPGQVFSFNQAVGDISAATGFKQAYVIKEGRTVLDDGGGVCQDSTTLFRAVLKAGLPIVKRTAHAYRVSYYEQGFPPGLDATVFYPSVDFQFKNDTPAHILIQAYTYGTTLYFDLYGTSDGRIVNLTQPVITSQTPPPPELRQDDPSLPKGTVKQVDWSAWGATVIFKRTVTRNGETLIDESWRSNYKPWQAVYLVGTKE
jgi:vancomycin resistance protein YoaR